MTSHVNFTTPLAAKSLTCYRKAMSKRSSQNLSFEERTRLAAQVKELRLAAGMKQEVLARDAGISRQALSNIERGATPQAENLHRIYEVLGVELNPAAHEADTNVWLGILGGMLDTLEQPRRGEAGQAAVTAVAAVIARPNVSSNTDTDQPTEYGLAAHPDTTETGEEHY